MELVTIALATFMAVVFVLGALPFKLPMRLMPLAVSGIGYGIDVANQHYPTYVFAAAAAGLAVLVSRYAVRELPGPWFMEDFLGWLIDHTPKPKPRHRRLPQLPEGVGQRIPRI